MLEELDANDPVKVGIRKLVIDNIASNNSKVWKALDFGNRVNVRLLRVRVGEGGNVGVWQPEG